jgi:UDP-N-acetylglucosamine enolpyruvyl transferase
MSDIRSQQHLDVIDELAKLGFAVKEVSPDKLSVQAEIQTEVGDIRVEVLLYDGSPDFGRFLFPQFNMWAENGQLRRDLIFAQRFEYVPALRELIAQNYIFQSWFSRKEEIGRAIMKEIPKSISRKT